MTRLLLTLSLSLVVASFASADAPKFRCVPAASPVVVVPVREVQPVVLFAEAAFVPFDNRRKDVFYFSGPPPALLPGLTLGILANGQEVRGIPSQSLTESRAALKALIDAQSTLEPLAGYEGATPPVSLQTPPSPLGASLRASCASCHTVGNARGGVTLFDRSGSLVAGIDWRSVLEATQSDGRTPPRMPPATSGKTPLSAAVRTQVQALVR